MQATADSRIVKIMGVSKATGINKALIDIREFPNKDIRRCPAIKFAVKRTHRVMGRIRFLVNSIRTINDMSAPGVPWGNRWDSMWFVFFIHPNVTMASHLTKDKGRVTTRCEVTENTCGYKAVKFINKIVKNTVRTKFGTLFSDFFKVNDISL